jgi:TonB-linked SusC/RagA family outer membrane protein
MRRVLVLFLVSLLLPGARLLAQDQGTISGTVTSETGQPLEGASVSAAGRGALTDADGRYTISGVPAGLQTVRANRIGYTARETPVTVVAGQAATVDFQLAAQAVELEGLVAVGYGTQKKASVTGSVASVESKELARTPAVTVSGALVGKVPGVLARQPDARPGASTRIQIRNLGTPLFVIDGIPKDEGQFNNIDVNDIESISVLKDASAAAIYGVRASNGVVLVTTKRGRRGSENRVEFKSYYGWQNWARFPELADAATFVRAQIEADMNVFGRTNWTPEQLAKWQAGTEPGFQSFDWYDFAVQENAPQNYFNLSTSGGSDRINYYLSAARIDQEGNFEAYKFNRTNLQANIESLVGERLKVGAQINGRVEARTNPGNPGWDDYWIPIFGIFRNTPTERAYANDNPLYPAHTSHFASNHATLRHDITGYREDTWRVLQANLSAEYDTPLPGLTATGRYAYYLADQLVNTFEYTYDVYSYDPATDSYNVTGGNQNPWRDRTSFQIEENVVQLQLNYDQLFADVHGVGIDLAFESTERLEPGYWLRSYPTTNALALINTNEFKQINDWENESARMGYVVRTNYNYDDRYLLEFAGRYDGSWRFPPDKRWGWFPSASAGWRISSESFYENSGIANVLTDLKLRGSYGQLGDENLGPFGIGVFDYLQGYDFRRGSSVLDGQLVTGVQPRGLPATNYSWITSTMANVGLDFGLWDNALSGSVDVFRRERTGLPARRWDVLLPREVAIDLPRENLNADAHMGIEGSLAYASSLGEDLQYSLGVNATFARKRDLYTYRPRFGNSWDEYRNSIEDRWAAINWGYEVIGQFQSQEEIDSYLVNVDGQNNSTLLPGDFVYRDINEDGVINWLDERPIGFSTDWGGQLPYLSLGFNTSAAYKGLDLSLHFAGGAGQSYERAWEMKIPFQNNANSPAYMFEDRWHREDAFDPNSRWVPGTYPALRKGMVRHSNMRRSDFWVHNVRYLRLHTAEIGYSLPKRWLGQFSVSDARLFVNGYNLLSLDNLAAYGIDPEISAQNGLAYPKMRTINIGANLGLGL